MPLFQKLTAYLRADETSTSSLEVAPTEPPPSLADRLQSAQVELAEHDRLSDAVRHTHGETQRLQRHAEACNADPEWWLTHDAADLHELRDAVNSQGKVPEALAVRELAAHESLPRPLMKWAITLVTSPLLASRERFCVCCCCWFLCVRNDA